LNHRKRSRGRGLALVAFTLLAVSGCGSREQSSLDPESHPARLIERLWWWMLGGSCVVFAGAVAFLVLAYLRRRRSGLPVFGEREGLATALVVAFGIAIPVVTLAGLFTASNIFVIQKTSAPSTSSTDMTIQVIGHQWWWEIRYPGSTAVTANEMHIPTRTRINLVVRTADVIHSFWVPRLNRKIDLIPGQENRILLYAERPGRFRGQCAEFCGVQHAHMALRVYAESPEDFRTWLADEAAPATEPATALARRGEDVFLSNACASCHTIRGTDANGRIGPDLTHVGERDMLAAETIPNSLGYLGGWILDPQHVKPGNKMPGLNLSGPDFRALLHYVDGLRFARG
jgi:cytochrome c oxidase subunit II